MNEPPYRRGDVLLVDLPLASEPTNVKVRPAVVIQNDTGNRFSPNLILASVSSRIPQRMYPTDLLLRKGTDIAEGAGLDRDSVVNADTIYTLGKNRVVRALGRLGSRAMAELDTRLKVSLGLD